VFSDTPEASGVKLAFQRKAQLLAADLHLRFRSNEPLLSFSDIDHLSCDSGAYTAAQLRASGCIECGGAVAAAIAAGTEVPAGPRERAIRAAAVTAGAELAAAVGVPAWQLGRWLQQTVDREGEQDLLLHRTVQTVAY
jgi:hypothetical protein